MRVCVIVLHWNHLPETLECLNSLAELSYPNYEVLLIDNGSREDATGRLQSLYPEIRTYRIPENAGFARACNIGLRLAFEKEAEACLLLNNDTVVDKNLLASLVNAHLGRGDEGFLGPQILNFRKPDRIMEGVQVWSAPKARFDFIGHGKRQETVPAYHRLSRTDYVSGCAFFVSRSVYEKVGGFDERYFCYFEDIDLCYRAARQGFIHYCVPDARVWHKGSVAYGSAQSPEKIYFIQRNRLLWAGRFLPFQEKQRVWAQTLKRFFIPPGGYSGKTAAEKMVLILRSLRHPVQAIRFRAVIDVLRGRSGDYPQGLKSLTRQL